MQTSTGWQPTFRSDQPMDSRQWPTYLPSDLRADWDLVISAHHNLLLVGTSSATNEMLVAMKPHLRTPIHQYALKSGGLLPQPVEGTLILSEVARLELKQQTQLLRWLDQFHTRSHVQVVSTTCEPLFKLVETGAFLPHLYYRLNVVLIELTASGEENL